MRRAFEVGECDFLQPADQAAKVFPLDRTALNSAAGVIIGTRLPTLIGQVSADGPGPWTLALKLDLTSTDLRTPNPLYRGNSLATAEAPNLVKGSTIARGSPSLRFMVAMQPGGVQNIPQTRVVDLVCGAGAWMGTVAAQAVDIYALDLLGGESTAGVAWSTAILSACLTSTYEAGARPPVWTSTDWLRMEPGVFQVAPVLTVPPPGARRFSVTGQMQPLVGIWPTMQLQGVIGGGQNVFFAESVDGVFADYATPRVWPTNCEQLGLVNAAGDINAPTEPWGNVIGIHWEAD